MPKEYAYDVALQSAATATGNGTAMDVSGLSTVGFQVSGNATYTITFECTVDNVNWSSLQVEKKADGSVVTTTSTAGVFVASVAGLSQVRARVSAFTPESGSVTVYGLATTAGGGGVSADIDIAGSETVAIDQTTDGTTNKVRAAQPTHDSLNANANLQVGDVDVSGANPVPVSGPLTDTQLRASAVETAMGRQRSSFSATIPQNQALSGAIEMGPHAMGGVQMPADWTAASLGFKVALTEEGTYQPLYDDSGALVQISGVAASKSPCFPARLAIWPWFKLWSQDGAGNDVNQAAERTLTGPLVA